jgi:hypothetical protein
VAPAYAIGTGTAVGIRYRYPLSPGTLLLPSRLNVGVLDGTQSYLTQLPEAFGAYYFPHLYATSMSPNGTLWVRARKAAAKDKIGNDQRIYSYRDGVLEEPFTSSTMTTSFDTATGDGLISVQDGTYGITDQGGLFFLLNTTSTHASIIPANVNNGVDMGGRRWIRFQLSGETAWTVARVTDGSGIEIMAQNLDAAPSSSDVMLVDGTLWLRHKTDGLWHLADIGEGFDTLVTGWTSMSFATSQPSPEQEDQPWGFHGYMNIDGQPMYRFCSWQSLATCDTVPVSDPTTVGTNVISNDNIYLYLKDTTGTGEEVHYLWRNLFIP